ncbi:hypothetical protein [Eubacterium maltosivorans]|uniref:hypothetical protein n=1 Tax=Eubacterium maltosivorans TaxID=2041044 RepID=UPI001A98C5A3
MMEALQKWIEAVEAVYEQIEATLCERLEAFLSEGDVDLPTGPPAPPWITKTKAAPMPLATKWVKASAERPP